MVNIAKPHKFQYRSEFNSGALDFERFDKILQKADDLQCMAILMQPTAILQYYAVTRNIFNNLKPLLLQNKKEGIVDEYQIYFDKLWDKISEFYSKKQKTFPVEFYRMIELLHGDMMSLRQSLGIGVPLTQDYAISTLIEKGLNVGKRKFK